MAAKWACLAATRAATSRSATAAAIRVASSAAFLAARLAAACSAARRICEARPSGACERYDALCERSGGLRERLVEVVLLSESGGLVSGSKGVLRPRPIAGRIAGNRVTEPHTLPSFRHICQNFALLYK